MSPSQSYSLVLPIKVASISFIVCKISIPLSLLFIMLNIHINKTIDAITTFPKNRSNSDVPNTTNHASNPYGLINSTVFIS